MFCNIFGCCFRREALDFTEGVYRMESNIWRLFFMTEIGWLLYYCGKLNLGFGLPKGSIVFYIRLTTNVDSRLKTNGGPRFTDNFDLKLAINVD